MCVCVCVCVVVVVVVIARTLAIAAVLVVAVEEEVIFSTLRKIPDSRYSPEIIAAIECITSELLVLTSTLFGITSHVFVNSLVICQPII